MRATTIKYAPGQLSTGVRTKKKKLPKKRKVKKTKLKKMRCNDNVFQFDYEVADEFPDTFEIEPD